MNLRAMNMLMLLNLHYNLKNNQKLFAQLAMQSTRVLKYFWQSKSKPALVHKTTIGLLRSKADILLDQRREFLKYNPVPVCHSHSICCHEWCKVLTKLNMAPTLSWSVAAWNFDSQMDCSYPDCRKDQMHWWRKK